MAGIASSESLSPRALWLFSAVSAL